MRKIELQCTVDEYTAGDELSEQYNALIIAATQALTTAYAPYSKFHVAAALRLEDGTIITGSNQENAAYPSGLCAERVAFFSAASQHPGKKIEAVAITTSFALENPVAPCGACRQVMAEYELNQQQHIEVILSHPGASVYVVKSVQELLPLYFSGEWLK